MDESKEFLRITLDYTQLDNWMHQNRSLMVNETITAIEELLFMKLSRVKIMTLELTAPFGKTIFDVKVDMSDADFALEQGMDWAIECEDYELAHRIKLLQEYLLEQKFKNNYEELLKTHEVKKPKGRPTKIKKE
jgi:hypothetical protein